MRADSSTKRFLDTKLTALKARGRRLTRLTPRRIGLRPEDLPYALSRAHFHAANKRLASIGDTINREILTIERNWPPATTQEALTQMAMLDRRVDRLRRTFGMFFEVMSQRGSGFAPSRQKQRIRRLRRDRQRRYWPADAVSFYGPARIGHRLYRLAST